MNLRPGALLPEGCDVLLVTVTDRETKALKAALDEVFGKRKPSVLHGERRTYADYSVLGGAHIVHVRSEPGSGTPGGSSSTVADAIREVAPGAVVMVGIAFGVNEQTHTLGTILVSKQLQDYDVQRIGTRKNATSSRNRETAAIVMRGDKVTASVRLLARLRNVAEEWTDSSIEFGLMLSGEKLVDNLDYRKSLEDLCPEALGGEMEGRGLYAEAKDRAEWIIVKAICDWADGHKRTDKVKNQIVAARMSAVFVARALEKGGFARPGKRSAVSESAAAKPAPTQRSQSKRAKLKTCLRTFKKMLGDGGYYEDWGTTVGVWAQSWKHWMQENLTAEQLIEWRQAIQDPKGGFLMKDVDRLDAGYSRIESLLTSLARVYN